MRYSAGNPTYQRMARQSGRSRTALADAAGGARLPKWETVAAYVSCCGGDPAYFRRAWAQLRALREGDPSVGGEFEQLSNLPRRPTPVFLGRRETLQSLAEQVNVDAGGTVLGAAVFGLGGVGKTELALQYAHAHRGRYRPLWWVDADTADSVAAGLAALTRSLTPTWPRSAGVDDAAAWALRWLAGHGGWLVVLDNVTDPAVIEPVLAAASRSEGSGRVVVTSRRDMDWAGLGLAPLRVPVLAREASVDLLVRRAGREGELAEARELAADLGDLPLAICHAAAYLMERRHVTVGEYRRRCAEQSGRILDVTPRSRPWEHSVARTWQVSITAVADEDPVAAELFDVIAYLAPDRIPVELLCAGRDPLVIEDALALGASYSLVTRAGAVLNVHRLVQAVIRAAHVDATACRAAAGLLRAALPEGDPETAVGDWERWTLLAPHIEALAAHLAGPLGRDAGLAAVGATLLLACAAYHRGQGRYATSAGMAELAVELRQRLFGTEHPDVLGARYVLAGCYWSVGRLREAARLSDDVLADRRRLLGADHPDTLRTASSVAIGYRELGRHDEAIALTEETLRARMRVLGPYHPETLHSRNDLAGCLRAVQRIEEATALYEATLRTRRRILGDDHPDTLTSQHNLALAYRATGRVAEAQRLLVETVAARRHVLGVEHPDTRRSQEALAACDGADLRRHQGVPAPEFSMAQA
ncbi:FxSxx-COOH system tetratricopeptide repeat protein [Micromonospora sp. B11E3]|uniref:FxSxx-COOH system tetratricopeptide repeat protein n=1 Tax=Micromonospora sp. B11E3 TaxID=3153562 RepID=UPI00325D5C63